MEDERGGTPRGASARRRAGEPAAQPTRATRRPPAAIFMEPAIPAPRAAEPENGRQREPQPPTEPETPVAPTKARPPAKAAPPAKSAEPAKPPAETAKAAPAKATPATAAPARAAAPAKTAPAKTTAGKAATAKAATAKAATAKTATAKTAKATTAKTATAKTAKATTAKATTPKAANTPAPVLDEPPVAAPEPTVNATAPPPGEPQGREPAGDPGPVPSLWDRVRAEPREAPELLARAAVERYGAEADRYTRWIRATYPAASDERIAQAAARRFTAQARRAAFAAVVGHGAGEAAALGWVQARMVLHIAAAYRLDPAAPERAAELLTLMRPARLPVGAGVRAAGRGLATRLVPGAGLLVGALVNDADTGSLARRAISLYRPVPRLP